MMSLINSGSSIQASLKDEGGYKLLNSQLEGCKFRNRFPHI